LQNALLRLHLSKIVVEIGVGGHQMGMDHLDCYSMYLFLLIDPENFYFSLSKKIFFILHRYTI